MFAHASMTGLARGRMLNRPPGTASRREQQRIAREQLGLGAPSIAAAAGSAAAASSASSAYLTRSESEASLRFAQSFSMSASSVGSTSSTAAALDMLAPRSPAIAAGFATAAGATVPKRHALIADPKIEAIRKEIAQLSSQEAQIRTKQEWHFGSQFLERYGYKWEEDEDGEVLLTRDINRQRVRIRFRVSEDDDASTQPDDSRDIVDPARAQQQQQQQSQQRGSNVLAPAQDEDAEPPRVAAGKPIAIQVGRLDLKGKEVASIVFYCEAGPENSIIINGLGGEDDESWGVRFDALSPPLKDKIIDYLCELEIAGDVSKYAREYAANLGNTNVPGLNRMHQFFASEEK